MSDFSNSSGHYDGGDGDRDQTLRAGPSCIPLLKQNYEVFLSFRGEETRLGFTDYLYHTLNDRGIMVFRDSEKLRVGEKIDQLLEAIKASKISVPIISSDYASSMWCLRELLQILECSKTLGQLVLPIFYKVKPSDVRDQKGVFGKKFRLCKKEHDLHGELVRELKNAFKEVTSMKGWESEKIADGHEGALVKIVVRRIFNELRKPILSVPDFLVGVEDRIKEIKKEFDTIPSNAAKIIVIHGMGGIGKTTLSKVLYNELSEYFEYQSFVANIREASKCKGMESLQKQVISDILVDKTFREISHEDEGITIIENSFKGKRLLLLLDDVKDKEQLDKLAAKNSWFGPESIVIITTRNKNVITAPAVNLSYELNELKDDQSYKLFCKHAFGRDASCPGDLETIVRDIIFIMQGLPLAIEVIGCFLCGKSKKIWKDTREKLRRIPNSKVLEKLKLSYDALDYAQQQIFLDIACLYEIKYQLKYASYMWKSCGFYPEEGIEILISLSLIKVIDENHVLMHDQLKDLGRAIVREEGCGEIGKCSRLWLEDEAVEVIERKQGTHNVQALVLDPCMVAENTRFQSQQFEGMTNLRFLSLDLVDLIGDFENIFLNLRWFEARYCDIMGVDFNAKKLVVFYLNRCNITQHWKGWSQMKDLKVLKLHACRELTEIPDLSTVKELKVFTVVFCWKLRKIHPSIGKFSKTLKVLDFSYCKELEKLPIEVGKMEELRQLNISHTGIRDIPISQGYLKLLTKLDLRWTRVTQLPDSIGGLCNLEKLLISYTPIKCLPTSIRKLSKLQELDLQGCEELESLCNLPCTLMSLKFHGDLMETLLDISYLTSLKHLSYRDLFERRNIALNLGKLNQLESLNISHSKEEIAKDMDMASENFNLILELPSSLVELKVSRCQTLHTLPNLSNLKSLFKLHLEDCYELKEINGLEGAESLTDLSIIRCKKLSRLSGVGTIVKILTFDSLDALRSLPHLSTAKKLEWLKIRRCSNLMEIRGLDDVEGLQALVIDGCYSLERISGLSHLKILTKLELSHCKKLRDVQGIEKLTSLTHLSYSRCPKIKFPDLSMLINLKELTIKDEEVIEIPRLQELKSLTNLHISCKLLQYLPGISKLTKLQVLLHCDCEKTPGLEHMTSLYSKGCTALRNLPNLPNLRIYS